MNKIKIMWISGKDIGVEIDGKSFLLNEGDIMEDTPTRMTEL